MTPSRGDGGSLQAKTDIGWTNRLSVIAMPLFYWGLTMLQGVKRTLTGILSVIAPEIGASLSVIAPSTICPLLPLPVSGRLWYPTRAWPPRRPADARPDQGASRMTGREKLAGHRAGVRHIHAMESPQAIRSRTGRAASCAGLSCLLSRMVRRTGADAPIKKIKERNGNVPAD